MGLAKDSFAGLCVGCRERLEGEMSWRVKQFLRKWTPIALMASVLFIGYTHWQRGGRANVGSVMTSARIAASKVPVFGSYFKRSGRSHYYRGGKSYAYGKKARRHRARRNRRGRRR